MKIYAGRLDEIKNRRAKYEASKEDWQSRQDTKYKEYRTKWRELFKPVKDTVVGIFNELSTLDADVNVKEVYGDMIEVRISVNQSRVHDKDSALSWDFRVMFDAETGQLIKESGSWSGLNATTEANIASLEDTLTAVKRLNQMNWAEILNIVGPDINDYRVDKDYEELPEDFGEQELDAYIDEAIETGDILAGTSHGYLIKSQTAKQIIGYEVDMKSLRRTAKILKNEGKSLDDFKERVNQFVYDSRIRKSTLVSNLVRTYKIISLEDIWNEVEN